MRALVIQHTGGAVRPPVALLEMVSFFATPGLRDRDPRLRGVSAVGAHNPEALQVRSVVRVHGDPELKEMT